MLSDIWSLLSLCETKHQNNTYNLIAPLDHGNLWDPLKLQSQAKTLLFSTNQHLSEQISRRSCRLLPVCWYPALSRHQDDVTQLPGPQVALHLAEGGVSVGQRGEHALLRARARLHGHARGQCGAAVGRPVLTRDTGRREKDTGTQSRRVVMTRSSPGLRTETLAALPWQFVVT